MPRVKVTEQKPIKSIIKSALSIIYIIQLIYIYNIEVRYCMYI